MGVKDVICKKSFNYIISFYNGLNKSRSAKLANASLVSYHAFVSDLEKLGLIVIRKRKNGLSVMLTEKGEQVQKVCQQINTQFL